jgi:hypothetical protein
MTLRFFHPNDTKILKYTKSPEISKISLNNVKNEKNSPETKVRGPKKLHLKRA